MIKMKKEFSWDVIDRVDLIRYGVENNISKKEFMDRELFELDCYEHIYSVKEGDVVLDLGASIGPFTWKIMDKASKVYTVEPMIDLNLK